MLLYPPLQVCFLFFSDFSVEKTSPNMVSVKELMCLTFTQRQKEISEHPMHVSAILKSSLLLIKFYSIPDDMDSLSIKFIALMALPFH